MKRTLFALLIFALIPLLVAISSGESPRSPFTPLIKPKPQAPEPITHPLLPTPSLATGSLPGSPNLPAGCFLFGHVENIEPVLFNHEKHIKRSDCDLCHGGENPLFEQQQTGTSFTMSEIYTGKFCGACHDGKTAFTAIGNCQICHNYFISQ